MTKHVTQNLNLPADWIAARPEFVRRFREIAAAVNPLADGFLMTPRTLAASATMVAGDGIILANATAGAMTITAMPADQATEKIVRIKKMDSTANKVFVVRSGADTFEGATTLTLAAQYDSLTLYSSGATTWWRF